MKLTKENEKIMRKAKRYIRTFPLSTEEIRQIEEDITGMALESQERGVDFMEVIGKPIREFCEDLVYSIGGMQALGGRKLLRISGIYFQLYGLLALLMGLVTVFGVFSATEIIYFLYLQLMFSLWDFMPNMAVIHQKREIKSLHLDLFTSYS